MAMNSTRRKLAIATWGPPKEGNIHGKLTLNAEPSLKYIAEVREATGEKVTMTHFVGKAVAMALAETPGLNGRIRWSKFIPHKTVDISFLVVLEGGADLAKAKIQELDKKPLSAVGRELRELAVKLRSGGDEEFESSKTLLRILPRFLVGPILWLTGWLTGSLGLSAAGMTAFPFGSAVITSVGMFGLDEGYAPFTPFARVPLLVLVGAYRDRPTVIDGEVGIQKQVTMTATIDHRFIDGSAGGKLANTIRRVFADPWTELGPPGQGAAPKEIEAPKAELPKAEEPKAEPAKA